MKQEDKDLLLKDLCQRQTYNVKCQVFNDANPYTLSGVLHNKPHSQLYFEELDWKEYDGFIGVEYCKPYLFPMSSMTPKQKAELSRLVANESDMLKSFLIEIEFYHKNHFDYRNLIGLDLAINATGLNIY